MIADGIYLNLDPTTYREDEALGGTDIKGLLTQPCQWHGAQRNPTWRALNPPPEEETAGKRFGSALHCMVLEPERYDSAYFVEPERPPLPKTKEEINAALAEMGRPQLKSSQKSVEYEVAARMAGIRLRSDWDDEVASMAAGRERISAKWDIALRMLHRVIERHSSAQKFISNGRAEVSIFWTDEHGTRYKCRFDYLRIRTVCDVKTYAQRDGLHPVEAFCMARDRFAYDLQAAHYMDCRVNVLPGLVERGLVFRCVAPAPPEAFAALPEDLDFFRRVAADPEPSWWWLACSTMGVPEVDCIRFRTDLLAFSAAQVQLEQARQTYRDFRAKFGENDDELWVDDRGLVVLSDANFSARAMNRGARLYDVEGVV